MIRSLFIACAFALALAAPMAASAHTTYAPSTVAAKIKSLANRNYAFAGYDFRLIRVRCQSRGGGLFACRGWYDDGTGIFWNNVSTRGGYLKTGSGIPA